MTQGSPIQHNSKPFEVFYIQEFKPNLTPLIQKLSKYIRIIKVAVAINLHSLLQSSSSRYLIAYS